MDIRDAAANDYEGVRHVTQITWLATYPNKEHGITKEEIKANFNKPPRRPIEEAKKLLEGNKNLYFITN